MPRESKPHRAGRKWRFRWSVVGPDPKKVAAEAAQLRQRPVAELPPPRPTADGRFRLAWSVVRSRQGDIWAEFARYQGPANETDEPQTVAEALQRWVAEMGGPWQRYVLHTFDEFAGELALSAVRPNLLKRFASWLTRRTKYGPETRRKMVRYASTVCRFAVDSGWLDTAPTPPRLAAPEPQPRALDRDELAALYRTLPRHVARVVQFMVETGLRIGETRNLEWSQVDFRRRAIVLTQHKTRTRTGRTRVVPLSRRAVRLLDHQQGKHPRWCWVRHRKPRRRYANYGLSSILYRRGVAPHKLRHTFAQRAIDAGVSPHLVSKLLGHRDSGMVWVYARLRQAALRQAVDRIASHGRARRDAPDHGEVRDAPGRR